MVNNIATNYTRVMITIPHFIDTKSGLHKFVWEQMLNINENIFSLFDNTILTEKRLNKIHQINEMYLENIQSIFDDTSYQNVVAQLFDNIYSYYQNLFDVFIQKAVTNEEFEIAQNLHNYYDKFVKPDGE